MKVWNKSFLVQFISSENIQISRKLHYLDPASASDKELPSRWLHFCSTVFFHFNGSFTYKMLFFPLKVRRNQFTERKKNPRQTGIFGWKKALQFLRTSFTSWMVLLGLHSSLALSTSLAFLVVQKSILNQDYLIEIQISRK